MTAPSSHPTKPNHGIGGTGGEIGYRAIRLASEGQYPEPSCAPTAPGSASTCAAAAGANICRGTSGPAVGPRRGQNLP